MSEEIVMSSEDPDIQDDDKQENEEETNRHNNVMDRIREFIDRTYSENVASLDWSGRFWQQSVLEALGIEPLNVMTKETWRGMLGELALPYYQSQIAVSQSQESQNSQDLSQMEMVTEQIGNDNPQDDDQGETATATITAEQEPTFPDSQPIHATMSDTTDANGMLDEHDDVVDEKDDLFGDESDDEDTGPTNTAVTLTAMSDYPDTAAASDDENDMLSVAEIDELIKASQAPSPTFKETLRARNQEEREKKKQAKEEINAALASELEALKQIEKGPSEAELRRRKLIEIDEDDLAFRIDRLNAVAMKELNKITGRNRKIQQQQMRELKQWIRNLLEKGDEDIRDLIGDELGRCETRLRDSEGNTVNAMAYLKASQAKDDADDAADNVDEEEEEENERGGDLMTLHDKTLDHQEMGSEENKDAEKEKEIYMALSDSEDEDEDEGEKNEEVHGKDGDAGESMHEGESGDVGVDKVAEDVGLDTETPAPALDITEPPAKGKEEPSKGLPDTVILGPARSLQRLAMAMGSKLNARATLKQQLRKKVIVTATENYCKQKHIQAEELKLRMDVTEKCRQLVDLLRERQDRMQQQAAFNRRQRFSAKANADEEEFDENGLTTATDTAHMTEEEKEAYLASFRESAAQSDDEPEEGDGEVYEMSEEDEEEEEEEDGEEEEEEEEEEKKEGEEKDGEIPREGTESAGEGLALGSVRVSSGESQEVDDEEDEEAMSRMRARASSRSLTRPTNGKVRFDDDDHDGKEEPDKEMMGATKRREEGEMPDDNGVDGDDGTAGENEGDVGVGGSNHNHLRRLKQQRRMVVNTSSSSSSMTEGGEHQDNQEDGEEMVSQNEETGDEENQEDDAAEGDGDTTAIIPKPIKASLPIKDKNRDKNSSYRRMLQEEERKQSKKSSALLDEEADEEEEEGLQAGLGDFGFGVTNRHREGEDENNALKLRKDDLDHIVDDVSDDEGDEEAGLAARMEQGAMDDRAQTKAIITAVTMGHEAVRRAKKSNKYAFDKLVGGRDEEELRGNRYGDEGGGEPEDTEEAEDEEEMLQRGLVDRVNMQRQMDRKRRRFGNTEGGFESESDGDDLDDSDGDEDGDDEDDEAALLRLAEGDEVAAEELRKARMEERKRLKEQQEAAMILRKQFEQRVKINRARRRAAHQSQSQAAGGNDSQTSQFDRSSSGPDSQLYNLDSQPLGRSFSMSLDMDPYDILPSSSHALSGGQSSGMGMGSIEQGQGPGASSSRHLSDVTNTTQSLQRSHTVNGMMSHSNQGTTTHQGGNKRPRPTTMSSSAGTGTVLTGPNSNAFKGMQRAMSMTIGGQGNKGSGPSSNIGTSNKTNGKFTGALNQDEVRAGYGMGMAVARSASINLMGGDGGTSSVLGNTNVSKGGTTTAGVRNETSNSGTNGSGNGGNGGQGGLFSTVTGILKRSHTYSDSQTSGGGQGKGSGTGSGTGGNGVGTTRRSFAASSKRLRVQSSSGVNVASQQFVFMGGGEESHTHNNTSLMTTGVSMSVTMDGAGGGGGSYSRQGLVTSTFSNIGMGIPSSTTSTNGHGNGNGAERSLFAKLSARTGNGNSLVKRSHSNHSAAAAR